MMLISKKRLIVYFNFVCILFAFNAFSEYLNSIDGIMKTPIRFAENPIITQSMSTELGNNINGPSLIKVPDWVSKPLGKYYLYFAHHHGQYIRLAYADDLHGPWTIHSGGVLDLEDTACRSHVASPDVHVLEDTQEIVMYFHGVEKDGSRQLTYRAASTDGLNFQADSTALGTFYFRVFQHEGAWYAIAKDGGSGRMYRSPDGIAPFEAGPLIFPVMRHAALLQRGTHMAIFFSRKGETPERIKKAVVDLSGNWMDWTAGEESEVLRPEMDYEGANLPLEPSVSGWISVPVNQLRDPAIYEEDNRVYLLYSGAGETNLCVAELVELETKPLR